MRFFVILMIFSLYYLSNIYCRPTDLEEETDSETNDGEYESDNSSNNEYLKEDEETAVDETPQIAINQDGANVVSEDQQIILDPKPSSNRHFDAKAGYEMVAENESTITKNCAENDPNYLKHDRGERYLFEKENLNNFVTNSEVETERSRAENGYEKSANDNLSEEFLFQLNHDQPNGDNRALMNQAIDEKQQYLYNKQNYNNRFNKNRLTKNDDYSYHVERDRRQVSNHEENLVTEINNVQNENNNLDNTHENAILKNIKKLSEQDLEELLNSLPEDKKALLRKIMNKREITKKAGAMEESNFLDQSDTSKIDGSFSVSSLSSVTDYTETTKHDDNTESTSTKNLFSKDEKSGSKSGNNEDTGIIIDKSNVDSKNDENLNSKDKEEAKNENKREIYERDTIGENISLENPKYKKNDGKNINNYPVEMDCFDNENWYEPNNEESQPQKRDVSQYNSLELSDSVKKFEESFPSVNAYEDIGSDGEPRDLIRVKRTELHHRVKKRDLPYVANDIVSCIAGLDNEESKNIDASEFDDKGFIKSRQYIYTEKDHNRRIGRSAILNRTQNLEHDKTNLNLLISPDGQKVVSESDKIKLGSDTDCVLSGIEGVDDNIMLNSLIRNKRTLFQSDNIIETNSINDNINETDSKKSVHNYIDSDSKICMDEPRHQNDAAIGTLSLDSGEDVGRYKRIKRFIHYSKLKNM